MADIPVPRSRSQILGGMISTFQTATSLPSLPAGDPILSILEAAAVSDLRNAQDIFNVLLSQSLDSATGIALQQRGLSEGVIPFQPLSARGVVTIADDSFTKEETQIYQGGTVPIVGSTTIKVEDAQDFGSAPYEIYIGRGTVNVEGPLSVTNAVDSGSYWTLTLASGTTKLHQLGESVILAQGGIRTVTAGTLVQTSGGPVGSPVVYRTIYQAVLPDGETEISNVQVICQTPGSIGNVGVDAIVEFVSEPFSGATVTNPSIFANGRDTETDDEYKARIRKTIQSRTQGTKLAIETAVAGATAQDENKTVVSTSFVKTANQPATLYIDDGTGYEEISEGVAYETIVDSAIGGESYFSLAQGRPVAKALLQTTLSSPFNLTDGSQLAFDVGGTTTYHIFSEEEFTNISNASAYEVAASINKNPLLDWAAKVTDSGTKVAVSAKSNTDDTIRNAAAETGFTDANVNLGFPSDLAQTLRLFKDDVELSKDGREAYLTSQSQSLWNVSLIVSGCTLELTLDGIDLGTTFTTFEDQDFVDAQTDYTSVNATNSLAAWAKVFNYKIPGVTTTVSGASLVMTSNKGASSLASLAITGGTLSTAMWSVEAVEGVDSDYVLDRNLGQILLAEPLTVGQKLTSGSYTTNAFISSPAFDSIDIAAEATSRSGESGAELWFDVDGNAVQVANACGVGTEIDVNQDTVFVPYTANADPFVIGELVTGGTSSATGYVSVNVDDGSTGTLTLVNVTGTFQAAESITGTSGSSATAGTPVVDSRVTYVGPVNTFANVEEGQWVIFTDAAFDVANKGAFKVADAGSMHVSIQQPSSWADDESVVLQSGNIYTYTSDVVPQRVYVPTDVNETAFALADSLSSQLVDATATAYRTSILRVYSNAQDVQGSVALVAANDSGIEIGLPIEDAVESTDSSLGFAVANHPETGTPNFSTDVVSTVTSETEFVVSALNGLESHHLVKGLRPLSTSALIQKFSNVGFSTTIEDIVSTTVTTRTDVTQNWLPNDRFYPANPYAVSPRDQLVVVANGDNVSGRFVANMYRNLTPTTSTYGLSNYYTDSDNSNLSLAVAFGLDFNWEDFAVHMKARNLDGYGGLWRYYRHGPEGENAAFAYGYPTEPNADISVSVTLSTTAAVGKALATIKLPSGAARTPPTIRNSSAVGRVFTDDSGYYLNYSSVTGTVSVSDTITGSISGATAVVASAPYGTAGTIKVTTLTGTWQVGENAVVSPGNLLVVASLPYTLFEYTYVLNLPISGVSRVTRMNYSATAGTVNVTNTITGATSGATATIVTSPASGFVTITAVSGVFIVGEIAQVSPGNNITVSSLPYGYATATLTLPTAATDHGLNVGDVVYMTSNDVNFTAGSRLISARTTTTISFLDTIAAGATGTTIGTISKDSLGEVTFTGSTVVAGDVCMFGEGTDYYAAAQLNGFANPVKLLDVNAGNATFLSTDLDYVFVIQWYDVNDASLVEFFPIDSSNTINDIVTAVNALDTIIEGTQISNGSVWWATYESVDGEQMIDLLDGVNYVKVNSTPLNTSQNYQLTFKNDVTTSLATGTDWANEDVRIVPITATNVTDYLNVPGVSGLPGMATVSAADSAPQIVTNTIGSGGSIEVQGGGANSNTAAVVGDASVELNDYLDVSVANSDAEALIGGAWVSIVNSESAPKTVFTSATALTSLTEAGLMTLSGTQAITFATSPGQVDNRGWQIEKQGEYIAYTWNGYTGASPSLSGLDEFDWVIVEAATSPTVTPNSNNLGTFRVVRSNNTTKTFWIQNSVAVEEISDLKLTFLTADSMLPGDSVIFGADNWGADNVGTWTVSAIYPATSVYQVSLDVSSKTPTAASASALGTSAPLFQVFEAQPAKLTKQILGICTNPDNTDLTTIRFNTTYGYQSMGAAYGSVLRSNDKLLFQIDPSTYEEQFVTNGTDGYKHNTGLIAECNRIIQGYEPDTTSYPGVAAAGDSIYISGPMIRRVKVSVAIRSISGVSTGDITNKVRSVIASTVNTYPIGQSIPISQIVSAVQTVNGVEAVSILEPTFNSTNDRIQVQPYEKALVLDLDTDITVTFVGN